MQALEWISWAFVNTPFSARELERLRDDELRRIREAAGYPSAVEELARRFAQPVPSRTPNRAERRARRKGGR